jgi:hypothetical protein
MAAILAAMAGPGVIGGDLSKIGYGPLRIFDPYARRNTTKAALISSSLAARRAQTPAATFITPAVSGIAVGRRGRFRSSRRKADAVKKARLRLPSNSYIGRAPQLSGCMGNIHIILGDRYHIDLT